MVQFDFSALPASRRLGCATFLYRRERGGASEDAQSFRREIKLKSTQFSSTKGAFLESKRIIHADY